MNQSHSEVEEQYLNLFGKSDGKTVHLVTNSVSQLYSEWRIFLYFFCGPKERVDTLYLASGITSLTLKNMLWDSALLKVRRLTDPARSRSNSNLSIENLVRISNEIAGKDIAPEYELTKIAVADCRQYADKYLAHRDLGHALGESETLINRKSTTDAIRSIGNFVQTFHSVVRDTHYLIMPISPIADEKQFLMRLHLGNQKAEELKKEEYDRAMAGEGVDRREYQWPDWIRDEESEHPLYNF
jgi:hypothetical protein